MSKNKPVIKTAKAKPVQKKRRVRRITHRDALEAAARLRRDARGKRYVIRFSLAERIEHIVLMISFTMLGITGLLQRYAGTAVGSLLLEITGGIEINRQLHHIFALIFFLETVYHFGVFLYRLFVYKRWGKIWPNYEDFLHFGQMMLLNLGLSKKHPQFGRFTFEEKVEYWALIWGVLLMGVTGVMQWFPAFITRWLPGSTIPVARALHSWEAVLAVLAILTWHLYHTVVKTVNKSIFTGIMTEAEMLEEHPAELKYLEQAAAALNRKTQLPPTKTEPIEDES
jgi:formate dehydrogenase gamma subunit